MKKINLLLCLLIIGFQTVAQVTTPSNTSTGSATDYVGWNSTIGNPLRIKHEANYGIEFYTNTGAGTFGTNKMMLNAAGYLGIGTGATTPSSWLHVITSGSTNQKEPFRTEVPSSTESNWRMLRGTSSMMRLWSPGGGNDLFFQAPMGGLKFGTGNSGTVKAAMEIKGGNGADAGRVGIGDYSVFTPNTMLHIHKNASSDVDLQLSNSSSGFATSDGLLLRMDNTNKCTFYNYEDNDIEFGTANVGAGGSATPRLTIKGGTNLGRVGIGTNSPTARLDVFSSLNAPFIDNIGLRVEEIMNVDSTSQRVLGAEIHGQQGTQTFGVLSIVDNTSVNTGVEMYGVYSRCRNTNTSNVSEAYNYFAENENACKASTKIGFGAFMSGSGSNNTYGAYLSSTSSDGNNFGLYALASGASFNNYGVYTSTPIGTCSTGASCSDAALFVNGDAFQISTGTFYSSDISLKKNILPFQNAKNILANCNVKTYDYDTTGHTTMNLPVGNHIGLIAQEVEIFLPNLVKSANVPAVVDSLGNKIYSEINFKAVNYIEFIPILIGAYKEQQAQIDSLLNILGGGIPRPNNNINPNSQRIELSDNQGIIINQNDPNPWSESTTITYSIPTSVKDARIMFTDNRGTVLRSAKIESRGEGSLDVYASELSIGIYTYTLICDGEVIESKKMMKM